MSNARFASALLLRSWCKRGFTASTSFPMANKITFNSGLIWTNGTDTLRDSGSYTVDQIGQNAIFNIQLIGITAEAITFGDTVPGFVHFKNLDAANFVTIGNDNAVATVVAKLLPGQSFTVPTTNSTWYAKADTGALQLLVLACTA